MYSDYPKNFKLEKRIACATCIKSRGGCSSEYRHKCFKGEIDVYNRFPQYHVIGIPKNNKNYKYSEWEPYGGKIAQILPEEIFEI
jgi:hypothetical protein